MRILSVLIICGFIALPSTLFSATLIQPPNKIIYSPEVYQKLGSLKVKDVQKLIGKKIDI